MKITTAYRPAGPVMAAFHAGQGSVRLVKGPYGSGKTSGAMYEIVTRATRQAASPADGVRYYRHLVIRDTYRNINLSTLPSWFEWFPKELGSFTADPPPTHRLKWKLADQSVLDLEVIFAGMGDLRIEDMMRGFQPTSVSYEEADRLSPDVITYSSGRVGRYPPKRHGGASWYGAWGTFNAPDVENYLYRNLVDAPLDGWELYDQPSGFSPAAENLAHLPGGADYYTELAKGKPDWWVRRYIENQWGYSREGLPVFPEFNDALHVSRTPIEAVRGIRLVVGLDAGLSPAAVARQQMPNGQQRTLWEHVAAHGTGPVNFARGLGRALHDFVPGWPADEIRLVADPSSFYGGDQNSEAAEDRAWAEIVAAELGMPIRPAPTNNIAPRLEAVRLPMTRMIDGRTPGYLMSCICLVLRKAYNSAYRFRQRNVAGGVNHEQYDPKPEKNDASHPADADQYAAMEAGEYLEVTGRRRARANQPAYRQTRAITDDDPTGGAFEPDPFGNLKNPWVRQAVQDQEDFY
jgi:hypothetical protein